MRTLTRLFQREACVVCWHLSPVALPPSFTHRSFHEKPQTSTAIPRSMRRSRTCSTCRQKPRNILSDPCLMHGSACVPRSAYVARKQQDAEGGAGGAQAIPLSCSVCNQTQPPTNFTNTQARKPDSARKCRDCSSKAEAAEAAASKAMREAS